MKIEATSITLDRPELAALLLSACADECRVNLCNVHVDPASGVAVTTDGHRLTVASAAGVRFPHARAVNLPLPMLQAAVKAAKVREAIAIAWDAKGACTATVGTYDNAGDFKPGNTVIRGELSSAQFPPWRAVYPAKLHRSAVPLTLNPYYLADVLGAVAKLQGSHAQVTCYGAAKGTARAGVTADEDAALSPIVFAATDTSRGCEWRMVIMPMRPGVMPSWQLAPAPGESPRESDATREREGAAAVAA